MIGALSTPHLTSIKFFRDLRNGLDLVQQEHADRCLAYLARHWAPCPTVRHGRKPLISDPTANAASIATRDGCSVRKVNMTISLAFLAPDLVKAAIEGRLPHGMGVVRLADLPAEWSRQHQMLGLPAR
jgi:hypothetical protein